MLYSSFLLFSLLSSCYMVVGPQSGCLSVAGGRWWTSDANWDDRCNFTRALVATANL